MQYARKDAYGHPFFMHFEVFRIGHKKTAGYRPAVQIAEAKIYLIRSKLLFTKAVSSSPLSRF